MKSKLEKKATGKAIPLQRCSFFLADDIRIEQGGKTSLLGFYPDNVIVAQIAAEAKDPTKKKPFGLAGIAILANFIDAFGSYSLDMELIGPGNETLGKSTGATLVAEKRGSVSFIPRFTPMQIVGFGDYKLVLTLNGKVFTFTFTVIRGQPAPSSSLVFYSRSPIIEKKGNKRKSS